MPYAAPEDVRTKLTTTFAQQAFDKLAALGPRWMVIEEGPARVYVSPTIGTKDIGGTLLSSPGNGWATSLDEAVLNQCRAIQEDAEQDNRLVVVNANGIDRAEFTYDKTFSSFVPYTP